MNRISLLTLVGLVVGQAAIAQSGAAKVVTINPAKPTSRALVIPGSLAPYERAQIHAKVTGYLKDVYVDIGDRVKRGQLLAELEIPEMAFDRLLAVAELDAANARLGLARAETKVAGVMFERLKRLHEQTRGAITELELEEAGGKAEIARANVKLKEAMARVAQAKIDRLDELAGYARLTAPFAGVVTARLTDAGQLVSAGTSASKPILEIANVSRFRLVTMVPETMIRDIDVGTKLSCRFDAFPAAKPLVLAIKRTSGALDPRTRSMRAEIDLEDDAGRYRAGMFANLAFEFSAAEDAVMLPAKTLHTKSGRYHVLSVDGTQIVRVPVELLRDDGRNVVVRGAITTATDILESGPRYLKPGVHVEKQSKRWTP